MIRLTLIAAVLSIPCLATAGEISPLQKPTQKATQKADAVQKDAVQKGHPERVGFWARRVANRQARRAAFCANCR